MLLTTFSEIYSAKDLSVWSLTRALSLCIAIALSLICFGIIAVSIYQWRKLKETDGIEDSKFYELFAGLKLQHRSRIFPIILQLRRMALVFVVVFANLFDCMVIV